MQSAEQQLIENLFTRLKQAESQSGPRDGVAEKLIQQQMLAQPDASYYMTQTILIQEAAMKQLNHRVSELEARLTQQQSSQQNDGNGSFLAGLFGGKSTLSQQPIQPAQQPTWNTTAPQQQAAPPAGRGFLGSALQTAVGVAGGVMVADMLTNMFHHTQPEEIVNIINEPAMPGQNFDNDLDTFNGNDSAPLLNQDYANNDNGFGTDDFNNDDFDDDSLI